jgi:Protein of unknown function (DUF3102)
LKEIKTHPALDRAVPLMTEREFEGLTWSIKRSGLIHPIVRAGEVVIDGRCRYIACRRAGVEPRFEAFNPKLPGYDDEEIEAYIWRVNFMRQSLNLSQCAVLDAIIERDDPDGGHHPPGWVTDEARLIVKYPNLAIASHTSVCRCARLTRRRSNMSASTPKPRTTAGGSTRIAAPFAAALVDEGSLTIDQGEARAEEVVVAPIVAEHVQAIRTLGRRMMEDALEIGRRLAECRRFIRTDWAGWLERELGLNYRSALNFMRIHELASGRSENFSDLRLPISGLYLLARPGTPQAVRDDIITRAAAGEEIGVAEIESALAGERGPADPIVGLARQAAQLAEKRPDDPLVEQLIALVAQMAKAQ